MEVPYADRHPILICSYTASLAIKCSNEIAEEVCLCDGDKEIDNMIDLQYFLRIVHTIVVFLCFAVVL